MGKQDKRELIPAAKATLGANISAARDRRGVTQTVLAKRASVDRSYLSGVENGGSGIGLALLLDLVAAIGCSVDELLGGVDERYDRIIEQRIPIDARVYYESRLRRAAIDTKLALDATTSALGTLASVQSQTPERPEAASDKSTPARAHRASAVKRKKR